MKLKLIILFQLYLVSAFGQTVPVEVTNINNSFEYNNAINQICTLYGNRLDSELNSELKKFSYHNLINNFKKDKSFKKLFNKSEQTITFTLLSKEYGILQSYVTLSTKNKVHTYSYNHELNKVSFVSREQESNTFLSFANGMQDLGYPGLILIVNSFPDGRAGIEVIKGLSINQMQYLLFLERYARNID